MNNRLIGLFVDSNISLNAQLNPSISLLRSPLLKLSKSNSLPSSVMLTDKSDWKTTSCGNPSSSR